MEFKELVKRRFSCRNYQDKEVTNEIIKELIEVARIAPSANNRQPWHFYVVKNDKNILNKVYDSYHREWFKEAPVVLVCCATKSEAWVRSSDNKNHAEIDVSIAIDHITLSATDLGLATCWICNFDVEKIKNDLKLADKIDPIALISLGYPNSSPNTNRFEKQRKELKDIITFL